MSAPLTRYAVLEAAACAAQERTDLDPAHDPFEFAEEPGSHSRLVSVFAWHPFFRRTMGLPPMGLFLLAWMAAALFHAWAPIPQIWNDETFTWELTTGSWRHLLTRLTADLHPPLYFALAKVVREASGINFFALRIALYMPIALGIGLAPLLIHDWHPIWRRFAALLLLVLVLFPFDLYLVQLRYYGLLALFLLYAVIALGNWVKTHDARWWWLGQSCCVLAVWTHYPAWLLWGILLLALRRIAPCPLPSLPGLVGLVALAGAGTLLPFAITQVWPWEVLRDATQTAFPSGFVNGATEFLARIGVLGLVAASSEFVPLWWLPLLAVLVLCWWHLTPRTMQSALSPTARLALTLAISGGLAMCLITATVIPVGVEFLPARLAWCLPLLWIGGIEFILRRVRTLRWGIGLLVLHLLVLAGGYARCTEALLVPAPAPGAPFLHATYLAPAPGMAALVRQEEREEDRFVMTDAIGLTFALQRTGVLAEHLPSVVHGAALFGEQPTPPERVLYYATSTRESDEALFAQSFPGLTLDEEWLFVHEDPLWYWLKRTLLRRDVEPYKYRLQRWHVPPERIGSDSD